jgi:signal transduction histidine kinase
MKQILITTFLLFFISTAHAQKPSKLDSLKNVLAHLPAEGKSFAGDTLRVRVLCEMGEESFFILGDSTLIILNEARRITDKRVWLDGTSLVQHVSGLFYTGKNEYMLAIEFLYKSLSISIEIKNQKLTAKNYRALGDCYSLLGNYQKAIDFNLKSIKIFENLKDYSSYLRGLNNLGLAYHDKKDFKSAISLFRKGLELNKKYKFPRKNDMYLSNLGLSLVQIKQYEEAIDCYNQVLKSHKGNYGYNDIIILISLAEVFEYKKQPQKALDYLKNAETLMSTGQGIDDVLLFLSEVEYKVYNQLNQPAKALRSYITFNEIKQRNSKQDVDKRIKSLQFEFDNKNQQKEIQILKRNGFIAFGVASILVIFGLILFRINKKLASKNETIENQKEEIIRANQQLEHFNSELEEKVELRTSELKRANADLLRKNDEIMAALVEGQKIERKRVSEELHDNLGSTISGIKYRLQALDLADFTEKEKIIYTSIMQMMNDAYSEVRLISHNLLPDAFEKKGLKGALEKLVNDINLSGKFKLSLIYREPQKSLEQKVAIELYSICLELVNNMIKHSNGSEGEICFFANTKSIILNVRDNGGNAQKLTEGFGLKNIKARVSRFNGETEVLTTLTETEISVTIPLAKSFQTESDSKHIASQ